MGIIDKTSCMFNIWMLILAYFNSISLLFKFRPTEFKLKTCSHKAKLKLKFSFHSSLRWPLHHRHQPPAHYPAPLGEIIKETCRPFCWQPDYLLVSMGLGSEATASHLRKEIKSARINDVWVGVSAGWNETVGGISSQGRCLRDGFIWWVWGLQMTPLEIYICMY